MTISAPGKIIITGEWVILEPENPGLIAAISKRAYIDINSSEDEKIHIKISDFNIEDAPAIFTRGRLIFENKSDRKKLYFIKSAIEVVLNYLSIWKPFRLEPKSRKLGITIGRRWREIGLGSSSAVVVGTVSAILRFHGINIERRKIKEKIYKLSALAHYFAQGKIGSGFDVAASTFGGVFLYKRFDPEWLLDQINQKKTIREIINQKWPGFYFKNQRVPRGFSLIVGWTRKKASTSNMVSKIYQWKKKNPKDFKIILKRIIVSVRNVIKAWQKEKKKIILKSMIENEKNLREFGKKTGVNIETKMLKKMSNIADENGGAGKLSGAGGGDCGIAVAFNKKKLAKIKKKWRKNKIYIINTHISFSGVREEK